MPRFYRAAIIVLAVAAPASVDAVPEPANSWGAADGQHPCVADPAQALAGRAADPATLAAARRLSGAFQLRIVKPGQPISMDYSTGRLTIEVDEKNKILRLYCG